MSSVRRGHMVLSRAVSSTVMVRRHIGVSLVVVVAVRVDACNNEQDEVDYSTFPNRRALADIADSGLVSSMHR